jgi:3-hydroxypropanoate dehydrogenase
MEKCTGGADLRDPAAAEAHRRNHWQARPVSDGLLREVYELMKWGPASTSPAPQRLLFLRTAQAREELALALAPDHAGQARTAPVVAVLACDSACLPHLGDAGAPCCGALQGAYLLIAARMAGLDCHPLSGFDADRVNQLLFPDRTWKVHFLCGLGYGDPEGHFPRQPAPGFDEVCAFA